MMSWVKSMPSANWFERIQDFSLKARDMVIFLWSTWLVEKQNQGYLSSLRELMVKYINRIYLEVILFISTKRIKNLLRLLLADLIPFGFRKTDSFLELTVILWEKATAPFGLPSLLTVDRVQSNPFTYLLQP